MEEQEKYVEEIDISYNIKSIITEFEKMKYILDKYEEDNGKLKLRKIYNSCTDRKLYLIKTSNNIFYKGKAFYCNHEDRTIYLGDYVLEEPSYRIKNPRLVDIKSLAKILNYKEEDWKELNRYIELKEKEKNQNNIDDYVEFSAKKDRLHLSYHYNNNYDYINLDVRDREVTIRTRHGENDYINLDVRDREVTIRTRDGEIIFDYYTGIERTIQNKAFEMVELFLKNNVTKIENGYILHNIYYEDIDDVLKKLKTGE